MNTFWDGVIAGIVGGLITSVILLLTGQWWKHTILPWLENVFRKGVRIDGVWKTYMKIGEIEKTEIARLTQKGHLITGTITYPEDTKGRSHTYEIRGEFYDNVFSALMVEVGKAKLDRGAILLRIKPGTSHPEMNGIGIWFYGENPYQSPYRWVRELD
jgi:hypothetical protein